MVALVEGEEPQKISGRALGGNGTTAMPMHGSRVVREGGGGEIPTVGE